MTIVTNGNAFSNIALTRLFDGLAGTVRFQVITTTGLRRSKGNRFFEGWQLTQRWGWRYTAYKVATYAVPLFRQFLNGDPRFVNATCRRRGIQTFSVRSVNTPTARAIISEFDPDLLLSYSCPYRIYPKLLAIPRIGCLNVHSSFLPTYAGVCTYVHVLADGAESTGITVHEMVKDFDAGRIVAQRKVPIRPGTSVCELFSTQCRIAGELLVDTLSDTISRGGIHGITQDPSRRTYCGEPCNADILRLRQRGFKLADWNDLFALGAPPSL